MIKRGFDVILSSFGFISLLPISMLIALLITLDSKGPVFYRGIRIGRFGRPFRIYKFRTMVADAENIGGPSTANDDPRITRVGKALRKYKLDELPQLINVLKGEMSLIGPRPEVPHYVAMYNEEERAILQLRPGLTDWASLWNSDEGSILAGSDDPDKAYLELIRPTKIKLQLEYVTNHSLWVDLKILILTVLKVFQNNRVPAEIQSALRHRKGGAYHA